MTTLIGYISRDADGKPVGKLAADGRATIGNTLLTDTAVKTGSIEVKIGKTPVTVLVGFAGNAHISSAIFDIMGRMKKPTINSLHDLVPMLALMLNMQNSAMKGTGRGGEQVRMDSDDEDDSVLDSLNAVIVTDTVIGMTLGRNGLITLPGTGFYATGSGESAASGALMALTNGGKKDLTDKIAIKAIQAASQKDLCTGGAIRIISTRG